MSLTAQYNLAVSGSFQNSVRMAALGQANSVMTETGVNYPRVETLRTTLAQSTIQDGCTANLTRFVYGVAATPGFNLTPADADIQSAMVSQWNTFAGVTTANLTGQ